jgi:hypothetical protein
MNHFITKLNQELNKQLQIIDLEETNLINKAQKSIACVRKELNKLKAFILDYTFKNRTTIFFFIIT